MSYDFSLFEMEPGADVAAVIAMREEQLVSGEPIPSTQAMNQSLAKTLMRQNPRLVKFESENYIELDEGPDSNGIQIGLYDGEASVAVPYWHTLPESRKVLEEIWGYLRTIQQVSKYVIYDPQFGRLLDLDADFELVLGVYSPMVDKISNVKKTINPKKREG